MTLFSNGNFHYLKGFLLYRSTCPNTICNLEEQSLNKQPIVSLSKVDNTLHDHKCSSMVLILNSRDMLNVGKNNSFIYGHVFDSKSYFHIASTKLKYILNSFQFEISINYIHLKQFFNHLQHF